MKYVNSGYRRAFAIAAFILSAASAAAPPDADYAEGLKRYSAGDVVSAIPLLRKAADAGHPAAQALIGEILDQADSDEEAIRYFRKSAEQGNPDGQMGLGAMLAAGQGAAKNPVEARKWISLAAAQGQKLAINELAGAYLSGGLGIPEHERGGAEALKWIRQAAENGYVPAMESLAAAYRDGRYGLTSDPATAEEWTEKVNKALGVAKGKRTGKGTRK